MKSTNLNIINTSSRFEKDVELKSTELSGNLLDKFLCIDSNGTVLLKSDADRSTFTNQVTLNTLENASADTDKFLVADSSGVIKFRTGSEMQSDLNVANVTLAGTPDYITISGQEITRNQIDLAADVTGTLPVSNGGTGAATLTSNSVLTGNGTSAIQAESTLTYNSNSLSIGGDDDSESAIKRSNHSDDSGGNLSFTAGGGGGANKTGGNLKLSAGFGTGAAPGGSIQFFSSAGGSVGSGENTLVEVGSISSAGNLQVDGTLTTGGDITVGGNDIKNSNGDTCITFDGSGNTTIAGLLTFPAPTSGADTATAVVIGPDDDGTNSIKRNSHTDGNGGRLNIQAGSGESTNANGGDLDIAAGIGKGSGTPGQITFRTATAYSVGLADDTAHSTSTRLTISDKCEFGAGGFSLDGNTITGIDDSGEFTDDDAHIMTSAAINDRFAQINADTTGQAGTVATIAGLAPNTATTAAAQPNITSLGTLTTLTVDDITINGDTITASADLNIVATGDDINIDTNNFTLESTAGNKPDITLKSTGNHNKPSVLQFVKDKGAAGAASDAVGNISFKGDNDAQEQTSMAGIVVQVEDATDGSEEGKFSVSVKNTSSSGTTDSFTLTGNGTATDASIGSGSASVTTIAGTLTMGSTATLDNSGNLLTNAATATNLVASTSTAVQLGTIELGHASDTTIARSAAGKVTIEGANVQTTQICCTHHNMSLDGGSSTVDYYFPINSLADGSGSGFYYTRVVAAYAGKIVKILFRGNSLPEGSSSNSFGTNSIIYMSRRAHDTVTYYHQTSGFQASETFDGSSQSTVVVPCGVGGANASDWVFDEGDVLGFSLVKNTTATDIDLAATIVWEYTV